MKLQRFNVIVQREDDWYVAVCVDNDVASQGRTIEESLDNLREALQLYYENADVPEGGKNALLTTLEVAV